MPTTDFLLIVAKEDLMKYKEAFAPDHGVEIHIQIAPTPS